MINTNLGIGTINAIQVALPHLSAGPSIIATGSTARADRHPAKGSRQQFGRHGLRAFQARLWRAMFITWQPNCQRWGIAPTSSTRRTATPRCCRASRCTGRSGQDLERPTRADADQAFVVQQAMQIPYVEPEDISNAVLPLASDEARYVTGMQLPSTPAATSSGTTTRTDPLMRPRRRHREGLRG